MRKHTGVTEGEEDEDGARVLRAVEDKEQDDVHHRGEGGPRAQPNRPGGFEGDDGSGR